VATVETTHVISPILPSVAACSGRPRTATARIVEVLHAAGTAAELDTQRQPSRLYAHSLADLIALSTITVLSEVADVAKFETATHLLRHDPEAVDLRIEDDGPRKGMWSVTQPQWVSVVRRAR
jgi:hypothetical protein